MISCIFGCSAPAYVSLSVALFIGVLIKLTRLNMTPSSLAPCSNGSVEPVVLYYFISVQLPQ